MYSITKSFKFEAAHRLMNMPKDHPCSNFHGHSYVVKVTISTPLINDQGMVIDFGKLKSFQKWLDDNFDHATILNPEDKELYNVLKSFNFKIRTMPNGDPTAENMASFFYDNLLHICYENNVTSGTLKIEVQETVGNSATFETNFVKY